MAAAHHAEGIRRREIARGGPMGGGLLAGLGEAGLFLALVGERAHAEHAVLALQLHVDAFGNVVRNQRRNADAEIDVVSVAQFLSRARCHLITGPGHRSLLFLLLRLRGTLARSDLLDALLAGADLD